MRIKDYKAIDKGVVRGTFSLIIDKWAGLEIRGMTVFESDKGQWITFPSKQYETKEDPGKKKYWPYVAFESKETSTKFMDKVKELLIPYVKPKSELPQQMAMDLDDELPF